MRVIRAVRRLTARYRPRHRLRPAPGYPGNGLLLTSPARPQDRQRP